MNSNLDVWAIQYYPEELNTALAQINEGMNIIYSNCTCNLTLGTQIVTTRQFDTILYNEDSGILILLMRGGIATKADIIKYLEANSMRYSEVSFAPSIVEYSDGDNIPELWFSREKYVLEDALKDSTSKGINDCEFYPNILGNLNLGYIGNNDHSYKVDGRDFKGLVKIKDKIILIINQPDNVDENNVTRNMRSEEIIRTINDYMTDCDVIEDKEPELISENFSRKIK